MWAFLGVVVLAAAGIAAAVLVPRLSQARPTPEELPEPVVAEAPAIDLEAPADDEALRYADELAWIHRHPLEPDSSLRGEFAALMDRACKQYDRSTPMQIRDGILQVYSLRAYGRPDIDLLKAARMVVDWAPPSARSVAVGQGRGTIRTTGGGAPAGTMTIDTQAVTTEAVAIENVPVSYAVEDITNEIVGAYNEMVAAQWEAYYAQQAAVAEQILANKERKEAQRRAQEEALAQARAAQAQAQMDFQNWLQSNSVAGDFWRR